ncbi:MAG: FeoB-associated Cys-rich membrane protein [Butyrivibrio sp.]|nr:FeoB-associated Cys-rich membrane protein [Butyrivibrio sp.]
MASIIGNAIVIIALVVALFFAGRSTLRQFKRELSGGGCAGCGGSCSGCSGCSASSKTKGCSCNAGSSAAGK